MKLGSAGTANMFGRAEATPAAPPPQRRLGSILESGLALQHVETLLRDVAELAAIVYGVDPDRDVTTRVEAGYRKQELSKTNGSTVADRQGRKWTEGRVCGIAIKIQPETGEAFQLLFESNALVVAARNALEHFRAQADTLQERAAKAAEALAR